MTKALKQKREISTWVIVVVSLVIGAVGSFMYQSSQAAQSCPKGSHYKAGICYDNNTGDIVKILHR